MKNLKIITAVVVFAFLSLSFTTTTETEPKDDLHEQIVKLIGDSNKALANVNLTAEIIITLNEKSEIVVINVKSDNNALDSFVKSKLNYKKVKVQALKPGEMYRVPLVIKSE